MDLHTKSALAVHGDSIVMGRTHLIRGYENIEKKLAELGGKIIVREVD